MIDYAGLRKEQLEKRERGELMGIGISSFTEIVGAGPSHDFDILGLKMFDSCEIRVHPTGKVLARIGVQTQGQGHETTFAQIIAEELGFPVQDIKIEYGDTDTAPYGLGTYASRSTPVAGAAAAMAARKIQAKARTLAAHLMEVAEDDLDWEPGKFSVKGSPDRFKTIQEIAFAAYTNHPQGMEAGLEAVNYYDPPNLTFPFGSLHLRRRHRQGHGAGQHPPVRGRRRLRQHHQSDDRGRPDPRRPDDGPRARAVRGDHLRRAGQQHGRHVHGLPRPDRHGDARPGRSPRPSRRRRITRSAPRASASRPRSARRPPSPTPSSMPCGISASATSTSRSRPRRSGRSSTRRVRSLADAANARVGVSARSLTHLECARDRARRRLGLGTPERRAPCRKLRRDDVTGNTFARAAELEARAGRSSSPRSWPSASRPRPGPGRAGSSIPDGTIEGWVGGSCAQPVVVREALRALADGQPRLLRLSQRRSRPRAAAPMASSSSS